MRFGKESGALVFGCTVSDATSKPGVEVEISGYEATTAVFLLKHHGKQTEYAIPLEKQFSYSDEKPRSVIPLDSIVNLNPEAFSIQPGGCGFHSSIGVNELGGFFGFKTNSLDATIETEMVRNALADRGIAHTSTNAMELITNIMLPREGGKSRIVFASPYQYREDRVYNKIPSALAKAGALFMNSGKDTDLVSQVIGYARDQKIPMAYALTDRLPLKFTVAELIPYGIVIFKLNEGASLFGQKIPGIADGKGNAQETPEENFYRAKDLAYSIRAKQKIKPYNIYITMGQDGLMGMDENSYFWVRINPKSPAFSFIQEKIKKDPFLGNSTGDKISAYIFVFHYFSAINGVGNSFKYESVDIPKNAIRMLARAHFGYNNGLKEEDFLVRSEKFR